MFYEIRRSVIHSVAVILTFSLEIFLQRERNIHMDLNLLKPFEKTSMTDSVAISLDVYVRLNSL